LGELGSLLKQTQEEEGAVITLVPHNLSEWAHGEAGSTRNPLPPPVTSVLPFF